MPTAEELSAMTTEELTHYNSNWLPAYVVLCIIPIAFCTSACYSIFVDRRRRRTTDVEAIAAHRALFNLAPGGSSAFSEKPAMGGMPNYKKRASVAPPPPPSWVTPMRKKQQQQQREQPPQQPRAGPSTTTTSFYNNANASVFSISSQFHQQHIAPQPTPPAPPPRSTQPGGSNSGSGPFYNLQQEVAGSAGNVFTDMSNVSLSSPSMAPGAFFAVANSNPSVVSFSVQPLTSPSPDRQLRHQDDAVGGGGGGGLVARHPQPNPQLQINGVDAMDDDEVAAVTGSGSTAQRMRGGRVATGPRRGEFAGVAWS
jgi:hypothetical protein